jgi:hypothetical protein
VFVCIRFSGLDLTIFLLQGESGSQVNLVIPWLAPADQAKVFPNNLKFDTPADQEKYVREWAAKRTGLSCNFKVRSTLVTCGFFCNSFES